MGASYLIDSNAVIDYMSGKLPAAGMAFMNEVVNMGPKVSIITKIEVLGFNAPPSSIQLLIDFMNDSEILALTGLVADQTVELRKQYKVKLPDAIVAATALANDLMLRSPAT
jgi:predicted nucleic acid-binding protein